MNHDYYEILGIKKEASQDEIKKAYHLLANLVHSDHSKLKSDTLFMILNEAYNTLIDPQKRIDYDIMNKFQSTTTTNSSSKTDNQNREENEYIVKLNIIQEIVNQYNTRQLIEV